MSYLNMTIIPIWLIKASSFIRRFLFVWKTAWQNRHYLSVKKRDNDDYLFLPTHLKLLDRPPSPALRWTALAIVFFLCFSLCWALISEIDIDVIASGRVVTQTRSQEIQSLETGLLNAVFVAEGQYVHKGMPILSVNVLGNNENYLQIENRLQEVLLNYVSGYAISSAITQNQPSSQWSSIQFNAFFKHAILEIDNEVINNTAEKIPHQNRLTTEKSIALLLSSWQNKNKLFGTRKSQYLAELDGIDHQISAINNRITLEKKRENDFKSLKEKNYISTYEWLDQQNRLDQLEKQYQIQQQTKIEIQHKINEVQQEIILNNQTTLQNAQDLKIKAKEEINKLVLDLQTAKKRTEIMTLRSPADGYIQQLSTYTLGGVIPAGKTLMVVAPDLIPDEAEITLLNKDIGFVREGQNVVLKVDAYPYTRHGYLTGKIKSISYDARLDENDGLVYSALVILNDNHFYLNHLSFPIKAGMTFRAEIKTGKRRVIDYLLSPLQTTVEESFWER